MKKIALPLLTLLFSTPVLADSIAIGDSVRCSAMQDNRFGYVLKRTSETEASLTSFWPDPNTGEPKQDTPEKALKGSYKETKDSPTFVLARLERMQNKNWATAADLALNLSGKDDEGLRDAEGLISLATIEYDDKGDVVNAEFAPTIRLECGKKVKRRKHAVCRKKNFGGLDCDVIYQ